ncbi:MAG: hypothetical protein M1833_007306 [Piccolia ochrophora]|nr:MAG: hypothetical protein M1833_007306 [Piccolia ochrophora]
MLDLLHKEDESEEVLRAAEDICSAVGGLPIAITHIVGYMDASLTSLLEIRDMFKAQQADQMWSIKKEWSEDMYMQRLDEV